MEPVALSRPTDDGDRRHIRHVCGYGCVRCGATIYQYRTLSGREDVDDIVLLCPPCAHALIGRPNAEKALRVMQRHPVSLQPHFDRRRLLYGTAIPDVTAVPGVTMRATPIPFTFAGLPILRLDPPEVPGGAIGIGIILGRMGGEPKPVVAANEWLPADGEGWTFERPSNRYVISSRDRMTQIALTVVTPRLLVLDLLRSFNGIDMFESGRHGTKINGVLLDTPAAKSRIIGMAV